MPGEESELEIRPIYEAEDFGKEFAPELRAQQARCAPRSIGREVLKRRHDVGAYVTVETYIVFESVEDYARRVERGRSTTPVHEQPAA